MYMDTNTITVTFFTRIKKKKKRCTNVNGIRMYHFKLIKIFSSDK